MLSRMRAAASGVQLLFGRRATRDCECPAHAQVVWPTAGEALQGRSKLGRFASVFEEGLLHTVLRASDSKRHPVGKPERVLCQNCVR